MTWPALLIWVLVGAGMVMRGPMMLYLFSISGAFGTLQMLPGEAVGGTNLLPQCVCAAAVCFKILTTPGNLARALDAALDWRRMGLFTAFTVWAMGSAFILPRLFAGQIDVVPISGAASGVAVLVPSNSNITQLAYLTLSYLLALSISVAGTQPRFQQFYLRAVLLGGATLALTGLLDVGTYYAGLSDLLSPFRNVSYSLLFEAEAVGAKRIVGLLPEASVFGIACVTYSTLLTFLRPCFPAREAQRTVPAVIMLLLLLAIFSTSSSAYLGLSAFGAGYALNMIARLRQFSDGSDKSVVTELSLIVVVIFVAFSVLALNPQLFSPLWDILNTMVFQKTASLSYMERGMWTRIGWEAFLQSGGLGVGWGSVRVSNLVVSILGGTGVLGGLLFGGFLLRLVVWPGSDKRPFRIEFSRALRLTLLPWLLMAYFAGAVPDIAFDIAALFGMLVALTPPQRIGVVPPVSRQSLFPADEHRRAARAPA